MTSRTKRHARGVDLMCQGAMETVRFVAGFTAFDIETMLEHRSRAAKCFAEAGPLFAVMAPARKRPRRVAKRIDARGGRAHYRASVFR